MSRRECINYPLETISEREEGALKKGMRWFAFWLLLLLMGAGQAEEGVVDAQQQKEDEEGVIEVECEEEVEEGEVGCSSLVNCGQCISHPGCVYCRDPDFLLQERSPDLVFLSIISFLISVHLIYRTIDFLWITRCKRPPGVEPRNSFFSPTPPAAFLKIHRIIGRKSETRLFQKFKQI